ncbi:GNAT family N-acetyltransferase [Microbacterium aquimaris]|uniref:GNAT family N-acetyltransferase n=1 Tax=Microbacterium aquimaris TaxID=459816 RepID=UPI002AD4E9A1|nr:GNAT family N-acetyltransferase [Microbacterium aquimaris]MDZ8276779.1 GNAT family N-acetyltransferase [Microbacterium aquimaris]
MAPEILLRPYARADAAATRRVFLDAVTVTASRDYRPEQVEAWTRSARRDLPGWHRARAEATTTVAEVAGTVVGFSDVSATGHIGMMFVHSDHSGRGVGRALLAEDERLAREAEAAELTSDVSITARPFFERAGFAVVCEQHPVLAGIALTNFRMRRPA